MYVYLWERSRERERQTDRQTDVHIFNISADSTVMNHKIAGIVVHTFSLSTREAEAHGSL